MIKLRSLRKSLLILFSVGFFSLFIACSNNNAHINQAQNWTISETGLQFRIAEKGSGPAAEIGKYALIHETTKTKNGTMITDTWAMNFPIKFLVGGNQVIDGLDEAVSTMNVGERRKLIVPPSLSKRTQYPENGLFGPNDTLYYDVILLQVSDE